ncbi:hypothetical protein [Halorussus salinisoli]|uniref:hypothetical protein n=1 Tax=Halorussus salinisoli TaxID=2558242 RepID=UPI0010C23793|nr:hypothetical protein [Halorussus salinisoli]
MSHRQSTAIILAVGSVIAIVALLSPNLPHGSETWLGIAGVYLLTGILLGYPRFVQETDNTLFRYASLVAVISTLFPVSMRAWAVRAARPELALPEVSFILWQLHVLVPFVIAFMAPLGIAKNRREQFLTAFIIVAPFLVATYRGLLVDFGFGHTFSVLYYGLLLLFGALAGLPLYLYGRSL